MKKYIYFAFGFVFVLSVLLIQFKIMASPDPIKIYEFREDPAGWQLFNDSYTVTTTDAILSGGSPTGPADFVLTITTEDVITCVPFNQREWFEYQVTVKVDGNTVYSKTPIQEWGSIQTNITASPGQVISIQLISESIPGCPELNNNATLELSLINPNV